MTPEELAKNELEKLRKSGELTFPIDPFKILRDAGIYVVLKDFENLDGIIINDEITVGKDKDLLRLMNTVTL